jgi:pyridinium-3,5-bisthiocarboxylic acid mononucleotide nickel chelatase
MILWLNPFAGLSGDMLLGALLDAGAPLDAVRAAIASTGLSGWQLQAREVERNGIRALRAEVEIDDSVSERLAGELIERVSAARPEPVARLARAAISAIAAAEARIHAIPVEQLHLHEIGGLDTVVDTVGVAAALHLLAVDAVYSAPLRLGTGLVHGHHGTLPAPAPATLELVQGMTVAGCDVPAETVTPTGAALLLAAGCRFDELPAMRVRRTGYGAGTRSPAQRANILGATIGEAVTARGRELLMLLETTVDDVTGEVLGHLTPTLLAGGALDVWIMSGVGKKNRPVHVVSVLASADVADALEERLLAETGSLGVRRSTVERTALARSMLTVAVAGHPVRIKVGPYGSKPEYEDLVAAARGSGLPLRVLSARALMAAEMREPTAPGELGV